MNNFHRGYRRPPGPLFESRWAQLAVYGNLTSGLSSMYRSLMIISIVLDSIDSTVLLD